MKKKSRGFTLIEVMVVLSLSVIVLAVVLGIFNSSNKSLVEVDVKSTLQAEAEDMQMNISKVAMQAKGITAASKDTILTNNTDIGIADVIYSTHNFLSIDVNNRKFIEAVQINLNVPNDASNENIYKIMIDKANKQLILESPSGGKKVLSRNAEGMRVIPNNIKDNNGKLTDAEAVTFEIELEKKQGYSNVQYPVLITVNFRNANI